MADARQTLETALREPPKDLRAWIWSLAPFGKRVLVAAAASVMPPAIEALRGAMASDPVFADEVGDVAVLGYAHDAVREWLRDPATHQVEAVRPELTEFSCRLDFACAEVRMDWQMKNRARHLGWCINLAVDAARWTEEAARSLAAGDAHEAASRIAAGPAYEAAEAVHIYGTKARDPWVVQRVVQGCLAVLS